MIRGMHGMFHSSDAEASRAFMRDVMQLPFTDVGRGWLIFDLPEADVGFHPADSARSPGAGVHDVSFYCDDIAGTIAGLKKRGARFTEEPVDQGYGIVASFEIPGGIRVQLFEPRYLKRSATASPAKAKANAKTKPKTKAKPKTKKKAQVTRKAKTKSKAKGARR